MILIEPISGVSPVVEIIQSAKSNLDISASSVSSKQVIDAISAAAKSGVNVKIIVNSGLTTGLSKVKNIKIHHRQATKTYSGDYRGQYICTRRVCEFGSTGFNNALTHSINYVYITKTKTAVNIMNHFFLDAWNMKPTSKTVSAWFPVGPVYRQRLLSTLREQGGLFIETNTLGGDKKILVAMAHKGSGLKLLLPIEKMPYDQHINMQSIAYLKKHGVVIRWSPSINDNVHTTLIVGSTFTYLGCQPLAFNSLPNPYIMSALLNGSAGGILHGQFSADWVAARKRKNNFNQNSNVLHVVFPHKKSWL